MPYAAACFSLPEGSKIAPAAYAQNRKNTSISTANIGIKIRSDHVIYPKNDGIFIPFSSDMERTIKLGAFPM